MNVRKLFSFAVLVAILLLTGCKNDIFRPASYGGAYEVVVAGDSDSLLYDVFSTPIVGLPQSEPAFDVVEIAHNELQGDSKMVRNLVVLKIDQHEKGVNISTQQNVYAQPQVIITITTPSLTRLKAFMKKQGHTLRNYLTKVELHRSQGDLTTQPNVKAEGLIHKMFGIDMQVPAELTASKTGKDFLWLSNNAASGMANICIYSISKGDFAQQRDSVMRKNILGEQKGMYMRTASIASISHGQGKSVTIRGLWEMRNDAMGGAFVAYWRPKGKRIIVTEAFVYAPENKKRNLMRRLEAALYTRK